MILGIAPPKPIPIKDRATILFIERGQVDVLDGAFVVVDKEAFEPTSLSADWDA